MESTLEGKKVLVAEDEKLNQLVIKRFLEERKMIVTLADNGQVALDKALNEQFDLFLLDINMPEINGLEVARQLRERNIYTPIIVLTGNEFDSIENEIQKFQINDYLAKPVRFEELIHKIQKCIQQ